MMRKYYLDALGRTFREFAKSNRGASAVIIAFLAIPIFGAIGLSIDMGRAYVLKSKLSTAIDAAGLAVGRNIFAPTDAEIYADAQKYFDANFPSGFMGTEPILMNAETVQWDETRENITINVAADMNTTFMNIMGRPVLTVGSTTEIKRSNRGMELALVLDITGSMNEKATGSQKTRLQVLKESAKKLTAILYGNEDVQDKLWMSIIPYNTQVNIGVQNIGFLKTADRNNMLSNAASIFTKDSYRDTALGRDVNGDGTNDTVYGWMGCVEMRDHLDGGTKDMSDDIPNNDFVPYFYTPTDDYPGYANKWKYNTVTRDVMHNTNARGPNKYCPPPILPLTAEKSTINDAIDDLVAGGSTAINVGLVWGWRTISPKWNGLWYGSSTVNLPTNTKVDPEIPYMALPLNYGERHMDKVIILMTDGENAIGDVDMYTGYARKDLVGIKEGFPGYNPKYHTSGSGNLRTKANSDFYSDIADAKVASMCTTIKAAGVIIYTILFEEGNETLFRNCATSHKHYFKASSASDLEGHFNTIGQELSNLRISK